MAIRLLRYSGLRREFDAISSLALGFVQRCIGIPQQLFQRRSALSLEAGNAEAGGNFHDISLEGEAFRLQLLAKSLHRDLNSRFIDVGHDRDELLASDAAADVGRARMPAEQIGKSLQHDVSALVSVTVVHEFEVIQIRQYDPEGKSMPGSAFQHASAPLIQSAAVGKAGKRIGERQLPELPIFLLDLPVKFNHAPPDSDPGQQFSAVKWLREIVIGAGGQAL